MSDKLNRIRQLSKLALNNPNQEEARSAAMKVVKLLSEDGELNIEGLQKSAALKSGAIDMKSRGAWLVQAQKDYATKVILEATTRLENQHRVEMDRMYDRLRIQEDEVDRLRNVIQRYWRKFWLTEMSAT